MTLAKILLKLSKLRIWVGVGALLAAGVAVASLTMPRPAVYASASTEMLVDSPQSALANADVDLTGYLGRAVVFARLMTSAAALQYIGQAAGVPGNLIAASGPVEVNGSATAAHAPVPSQGGQGASAAGAYGLEFLQNPELPIVEVYAQAPTTRQAIALANGGVTGFAAYISHLEAGGTIPAAKRIEIRQLGSATGGVVDPGASKKIAVLIFLAVFALWCGMVLLVSRFRDQLRASRNTEARDVVRVAEAGNGFPQSALVMDDPTDSALMADYISRHASNHAADRSEEDDVRGTVGPRP